MNNLSSALIGTHIIGGVLIGRLYCQHSDLQRICLLQCYAMLLRPLRYKLQLFVGLFHSEIAFSTLSLCRVLTDHALVMLY
jgi:hypothetical protein